LLERRSTGIVGPKPDHVFVVVAETYMMWPLLEKYKNYPLATGMRRLLQRPDAVLVNHFLPASSGTMFGVTSVLLGIPELNLQVANRPTAQVPFEISLAQQLRAQGYKTRFFYGGYPSWENIGAFMDNQQVQESFYASDFEGNATVWGVPDRDFLAGVVKKIGPEPSFNFILTSSNHPPYRVDQSRESQLPTVAEFKTYVPAETVDKDLTASRMWHFAYADKYLAEFVETMLAKYPNSLFVITGDHAERWTLENSPSDYERVAVPLVLAGSAIRKSMMTDEVVGSHMDIAATVLELVLPKNTSYYALGENIFKRRAGVPAFGVAAYHWITPSVIGSGNTDKTELLPGADKPDEKGLETVRQRVQDVRKVAAWRVLKGLNLADN
ncbi:MAG: LTA synthase family protein, partial [Elusimicrobiaceae bacterium]|nr:LTA synthase family protein [Elusimicrobiaceae bacterium]